MLLILQRHDIEVPVSQHLLLLLDKGCNHCLRQHDRTAIRKRLKIDFRDILRIFTVKNQGLQLVLVRKLNFLYARRHRKLRAKTRHAEKLRFFRIIKNAILRCIAWISVCHSIALFHRQLRILAIQINDRIRELQLLHRDRRFRIPEVDRLHVFRHLEPLFLHGSLFRTFSRQGIRQQAVKRFTHP